MKKITLSAIVITSLMIASCDTLNDITKNLPSSSENSSLTNTEVISGLKEALGVGISNSVNIASVTDGFLKNSEIRLPFPADAINVKNKAIEWGFSGQVEKFETTLNRAAEDAAKSALPIFKNAITSMSIQDGFAILNGGNGAATNYLKKTTTAQLTTAFSPIVEQSISKVKLTEYWDPIITKYNQAAPLLGYNKLNPDLNKYVTEKAIDGLFKLVADEENKIRQNPGARVTELLQKVFGSIKK